jgi:flap endonuclease-1
MGIQGLGKLISSKANGAVVVKTLQSYQGQNIAVDASVCIYQFLIAMRWAYRGHDLKNRNGQTSSHLLGFLTRTAGLMERDIYPLYVFDGPPPALKLNTLNARIQRQQEAQIALDSGALDSDLDEMKRLSKRTIRMNSGHVEECKKLLSLLGLPIIQAKSEAEATCAALVKSGLCSAISTEDMDALTLGAPRVTRHLSASESKKKKIPLTEIQLDVVLKSMKLTMDQFIDLCIMLGCDYHPKLAGLGPESAYEAIKCYGSIEGYLSSAKNVKKKPDLTLIQEVRQQFKHPEVTICTAEELMPQAPNESEIFQFLCKDRQFSVERVEKALLKVKSFQSQRFPTKAASAAGSPSSSKPRRKAPSTSPTKSPVSVKPPKSKSKSSSLVK